ncbi:MAG: hypothetical protein V2I34_04335 [Bacteroidales bacterium]|jgi:hypothetical protein|nr:hypothetical protein [Bacteroidales bacterium]
MNKIKLRHIIDATIIAWVIIWLYYGIFNWDIFIIKLDANLGFAVIGSYPFVFFFLLGLIFLIVLRYFDTIISMRRLGQYKDLKNNIALLEKDIEVLKLRETVYKMQSEEMSRNDASLQALHQKLDELSSGSDREKHQPHDPDKNTDQGEA